jgi:hypothetical protein
LFDSSNNWPPFDHILFLSVAQFKSVYISINKITYINEKFALKNVINSFLLATMSWSPDNIYGDECEVQFQPVQFFLQCFVKASRKNDNGFTSSNVDDPIFKIRHTHRRSPAKRQITVGIRFVDI